MEFHPSWPPVVGRRGKVMHEGARPRGKGGDVGRIFRGLMLAAVAVTVLGTPAGLLAASKRIYVTEVRHWSLGDVTRIAVQTTGEFTFKYRELSKPRRIYFDILNSRNRVSTDQDYAIGVEDGLIKKIRVAQNASSVTRIVLDLGNGVEVTSSQLSNPDRLMIEIRRQNGAPELSKTQKLPPPKKPAAVESAAKPKPAPAPPPEPPKKSAEPKPKPAPQVARAKSKIVEKPSAAPPPKPTAEPAAEAVAAAKPPIPEIEPEEPDDGRIAKPAQRNRAGGHSLTRVLGLKLGRVVIDPGHGGRDPGTIGPTGLREKDITLDVSKRLAKLIEQRMGSEVVLTRDKDSSLKLKQRTSFANKAEADLFISLHVNASRYRTVNGVETFYLNFTRSRADLEVAARENAGSDMPMHELSNLVQKIALDDKIQESRDLASHVQNAVFEVHKKHYSKARNRGVKKAPLVVLIGAQMPSILLEMGFISNAREEKLMKTSDYRQQIAESVYQGIEKYAASLSHFQVAQANGSDGGE